jgi:hypothetical protein
MLHAEETQVLGCLGVLAYEDFVFEETDLVFGGAGDNLIFLAI